MTKIAGVPEELQGLSRALYDVAPEIDSTSRTLSGVSLPEMPPGVAGTVTATLGSVGQKLNNAATTVQQQGLDVGRRATWLRIAGEGGRLMTVFPPRTVWPWEEPQLPDFGPRPGFPGEPELPDFGPGPELPGLPGWPDYGPGPGLPGVPELPDFGPVPLPGLPGRGGDDGEPDFGPIPVPRLPDFDQPFPGIMRSDDGKNDGQGEGEGEGDGDGEGNNLPEGYPPPDDITTNPDDREHILDGDDAGGGHRPGTGKSGKSEFPSDWDDDKIVKEIEDVARNPDHPPEQQGGRWVATGERDGVEIRVVIRGDGSIRTGYPTNQPRNP
jgi:hypothetical protein